MQRPLSRSYLPVSLVTVGLVLSVAAHAGAQNRVRGETTDQWDNPLDYEAFAAFGGVVGHGGVVMFDDTVDMGEQARFAMEFCTVESCGKCTPCRIGAVRGVEVIDRIRAGENAEMNLELLSDLCETMSMVRSAPWAA